MNPMMTPRLQMKAPYYGPQCCLGTNTDWENYVREAYDSFFAPFAANEGINAIITYLYPKRRGLLVNKHRDCYIIKSPDGECIYLSQPDEDTVMLSLEWAKSDMELTFFDATDAARFIGNLFTNYRRMRKR